MKVINWNRWLKCNDWILIALLKHPQFFNRFQACKKKIIVVCTYKNLYLPFTKSLQINKKNNQIHTIKTCKKFFVQYGLKVISFNCPNLKKKKTD